MRAGRVARASSGLGRRIGLRRIFVDDFPLKAAAVFVAVVLWAGAVEASTREITLEFGGRVPVTRPDVPVGFVLRAALGEVGVKLRGPQAAVGKVAIDDLRATLDVFALDPQRSGAQDAVVRVTVADPRVKVIEVTPPTVSVRLERITSRSVPVQTSFANDPPKGYAPGTVTIAPAQVTISGPESAVVAVTTVLAAVRFGDVPVDLTLAARATPVDASGATVMDVDTDPMNVQVNVPVLPTATTRALPIVVTTRGQAAVGSWISRVTVDPLTVTVRGDQTALAALDRIETAPIDLNGLAQGRSFRATLILPRGITLLPPVDPLVSFTVSPLTGTRPYTVAVQVTGVASGLVADASPVSVDVVVSGPAAALETLKAEQVVATVDATGRVAGSYQLDVVVKAPEGLLATTVQPARVTVTMKLK